MSEKHRQNIHRIDGLGRKPQPPLLRQESLPAEASPARVISLAEQSKPRVGFRQRLNNWWERLKPKNRKQAFMYGGGALVLVAGCLAAFVLITSCRVFSCSDNGGALALQSDVDPTQLRGEGDGRINILLLGIGGEEHVAGDLSDTIILASIDPISKDVAMLSIPRDLYLDIPGYGSDRVNAAHAYGERDNYSEGGPGLIKETLSQALGVPIHYWARADFTGLKEAVDVVGGVEVDVEQTVYDYAYPTPQGGYQIFKLDAGLQYLDGDTALKFARSRHTTSDFDRASRQQQLLVAVKDKALNVGTLANPIKLTSLFSTFGEHVRTDLQVNEVMKLYHIAQDVSNEQIARVRLDNAEDNFLVSANIGGASVLLPKASDFSQIKAYVRNLFIDGFIKSEAAPVEVLNGSTKDGLATVAGELLKSFGYQVGRVDNAEHGAYEHTVIYDYTDGSKPYTIRYLEQRFGVTAERRTPAPGQTAGITVIVGNNYTPES